MARRMRGRKRVKMIVYNYGKIPIFIVTKWSSNPLGGPATGDVTYCVTPGQEIDLEILMLRVKKKVKVKKKSKKK